MPDVLIRNVPTPVCDALKLRSERNRRSLQEELTDILVEAATRSGDRQTEAEVAATIRARLAARSGTAWTLFERIATGDPPHLAPGDLKAHPRLVALARATG